MVIVFQSNHHIHVDYMGGLLMRNSKFPNPYIYVIASLKTIVNYTMKSNENNY